MKNPPKIGLTGGIGSGKSLICKILNTFNIPSYDSDSRAKWINNHHQEVRIKIAQEFGNDLYATGNLDTRKLASFVFSNQNKLEILNSIVHPIVFEDFNNWYQLHLDKKFVLKEAALLFESGSYKTLDATILITCPTEVRVKRVVKRDPQRSEAEVRAIIQKQMPEEEKTKLASYIIVNDDIRMILPQILEIYKEIINSFKV